MTTMTSRKLQDDITRISKVSLDPGDVLIVQPDLKNLPASRAQEYADALRTGLSGVFPNNKIVVMDKSIDISIIST